MAQWEKDPTKLLVTSSDGRWLAWVEGNAVFAAQRDTATGAIRASKPLCQCATKITSLSLGPETSPAVLGSYVGPRLASLRPLAVGCADGSVEVLEAESGRLLLRMGRAQKGRVLGLSWPEGQAEAGLRLLALSSDGRLRLRDVARQGQLLHETLFPDALTMELSPDGHLVALGHSVAKLVLLSAADLETVVQAQPPPGIHHPIHSLVFSADSNLLLAVYKNSRIGVFTRTGRLLSHSAAGGERVEWVGRTGHPHHFLCLGAQGELSVFHASGEVIHRQKLKGVGEEEVPSLAVPPTSSQVLVKGSSVEQPKAVALELDQLPSLFHLALSVVHKRLMEMEAVAQLPIPKRIMHDIVWQPMH